MENISKVHVSYIDLHMGICVCACMHGLKNSLEYILHVPVLTQLTELQFNEANEEHWNKEAFTNAIQYSYCSSKL